MISCKKLDLEGVLLFNLESFFDNRGSFTEVFNLNHISEFLPNDINFVQDNESVSNYGVLRGLHFQNEPHSQSKLIRVSKGEIEDVVVDIRVNSKTFGKHVKVELSKKNNNLLFVPKGFAHGFLTLSKTAIVNYKVDSYYHKSSDNGINPFDSDLNIDWKLKKSDLITSQKDMKLKHFKNIFL